MTFREYAYHVGTALSCLGNALIGGRCEESLSMRIGRSILQGGIASKLWMPVALRRHFEDAARSG